MSREIAECRRKFEERLREASANAVYGIVRSVDERMRTCHVQVGGIVYEDVLLHALSRADSKGFCAVPTIGSTVIVSRLADSDSRRYVTMFSQIDKVLFTVGDRVTMTCDGEQVIIDAPKVVFNGGALGGLVKIEQLTAKINEVIDALNNHTHQILPGGVAVTGSASAQSNQTPVDIPAPTAPHPHIKRDEYEDKDITH